MEVSWEGGKCFLKVTTSESVQGINYSIQIVREPEPLPPEYSFLDGYGSGWIKITLAEAVTGFIHFCSEEKKPGSQFLTNITPINSEEARRLLELPGHNKAEIKYKADVAKNSDVMIAYLTSSNTIQIFVPDKANLTYYGEAPTSA